MSPEKMEIMRHSCAHLVAAAVQELYPEAKFGVGPVVENGFYYDIDFGINIGEEDLAKIEEKAKELAKSGAAFERREMAIDEAIALFKKFGQDYKVELLNDIKKFGTTKMKEIEAAKELENFDKDNVSIYKTSQFVDLCRGPHLASAKEIGAFKLTKLAGAYWRGDQNNAQLQRVYGVCFATAKELDEYLRLLVEAEKRDHRKIGKELDLFVFSDLIGPGLPIYTSRGALVRQLIVDFSNELQSKIGYQTVHTPNINKAELFKVSGHYDKFKDDMLMVRSHYSEEEYFLKPMNCPHHTQVFAAKTRSYRDLPIRIADFANLYRDEKPGELSGLSRLRCFSQDDGHCFCREDQIEGEFSSVLDIIEKALQTYGLEYWVRLSLRDPVKKEKYLGGDEVWVKAEAILEELLKKKNIKYVTAVGEAAFYGPKMDLMAKDAINREWQISTIQLDFNMPTRFGLKYIDHDGAEKTPVMIHRAIVGSPERFMAILIEHYAGAFPVWLAPVQVLVAPVSVKHVEGARTLAAELIEAGLRVEIDESDETVGNKVRKAVGQKAPYILVIGDQELSGGDLMVRARGEDKPLKMSKDEFFEKIVEEVKLRK